MPLQLGPRALALIALAACGRPEPERPNRAATIAMSQDTGFVGTVSAMHRPRPGAPPVPLRGVEALSQPGYDRLVFQFDGDRLPGYHVEYATRPVVRCGSGDPVAVAGAAQLVVRLEPARAHDEQGHATIGERERAPGLPTVSELKLVCDFEGQVRWVLGVTAAREYRVTEDSGAKRIILDVRHGLTP